MRRRLPLAVVALLVGAVVAALVVVSLRDSRDRGSTLALPDGRALLATGSISPRVHLFGDTVRVVISVVVDRRRLDPARVRVTARFAPYELVGRAQETRRDAGELTQLVYTTSIRCTRIACLPEPAAGRTFEFPDAIVSCEAAAPAGADLPGARVEWPKVVEYSRVGTAEVEGDVAPRWQGNPALLPAVTHRVKPSVAFWTLVGAAALLLLAAATLQWRYLPRPLAALFERPGRVANLSPLERALAAVEDARSARDAVKQRQALELLSEELARTGEVPLALAARELAWSAVGPASEATGRLTANVRGAIGNRSNGHRV